MYLLNNSIGYICIRKTDPIKHVLYLFQDCHDSTILNNQPLTLLEGTE